MTATGAVLHPWTAPWSEGDWLAASAFAREHMDSEAALVERCLHGDGGAWEALVRSHTRLVYGTCYRFVGQPEAARDLTQEVFLRVFRSLHTYNARAGGFRTWLLRLTRNLLIDDYRKSRKHRVLDSLDEQLPALEEGSLAGGRADHLVAGREAGEVLQKGLRQLSAELREAVILRDLQEMEYREIAQVLRVPEGTVKSRINRGRRELAKHLRAMGVQP